MTIDLNTHARSAAAERPRLKRTKTTQPRDRVPAVSRSVFKGGPFDPEARREMIAEAAYCRAAQRGFEPGHDLDDWLAAEKDIDERLCGETHPF